jgi:hypothetical protein
MTDTDREKYLKIRMASKLGQRDAVTTNEVLR